MEFTKITKVHTFTDGSEWWMVRYVKSGERGYRTLKA